MVAADAQGHLVALASGRRQHFPLVVAALAGEEEGIVAAAHQVEANLLHGLAKRAGHGLGTDVGDEGAGEDVDLRQRATDPERLGEQGSRQESGVFLVALVECLRRRRREARPSRRVGGGASGG